MKRGLQRTERQLYGRNNNNQNVSNFEKADNSPVELAFMELSNPKGLSPTLDLPEMDLLTRMTLGQKWKTERKKNGNSKTEEK